MRTRCQITLSSSSTTGSDIPHLGAINSGPIQSKIALLNNLPNADPKTHISIQCDRYRARRRIPQQGRATLSIMNPATWGLKQEGRQGANLANPRCCRSPEVELRLRRMCRRRPIFASAARRQLAKRRRKFRVMFALELLRRTRRRIVRNQYK